MFHESQQTGGFACLPGGMEHEVLFLFDQKQDVIKLDSFQGWQTIVFPTIDGPSRVKETHNISPDRKN
jgi:hypothetical protein